MVLPSLRCLPHFPGHACVGAGVRAGVAGCVMRGLLLSLALATPLSAAEEVPSGQDVTLHEVLIDPQGDLTWLRFRFLAPAIARDGEQISFDVAGKDMAHLCDALVLPYLKDYGVEADRIVISFMDRITEFGAPDPDVTQYFDSFRAENGACIWDEF